MPQQLWDNLRPHPVEETPPVLARTAEDRALVWLLRGRRLWGVWLLRAVLPSWFHHLAGSDLMSRNWMAEEYTIVHASFIYCISSSVDGQEQSPPGQKPHSCWLWLGHRAGGTGAGAGRDPVTTSAPSLMVSCSGCGPKRSKCGRRLRQVLGSVGVLWSAILRLFAASSLSPSSELQPLPRTTARPGVSWGLSS